MEIEFTTNSAAATYEFIFDAVRTPAGSTNRRFFELRPRRGLRLVTTQAPGAPRPLIATFYNSLSHNTPRLLQPDCFACSSNLAVYCTLNLKTNWQRIGTKWDNFWLHRLKSWRCLVDHP